MEVALANLKCCYRLAISVSTCLVLVPYINDLPRYNMSGRKAKSLVVKLVSMAGTGYYYTTKRNVKSAKPKLLLRKYDPVIRQHTLFKVRTLHVLHVA